MPDSEWCRDCGRHLSACECEKGKRMDKDLFRDKIGGAVDAAHLIAWDGCHKIYLALDDTEADRFRSSGYECVVEADGDTESLVAELWEWWGVSCSLRFVQSVESVDGDRNDGFVNLISQFEEE